MDQNLVTEFQSIMRRLHQAYWRDVVYSVTTDEAILGGTVHKGPTGIIFHPFHLNMKIKQHRKMINLMLQKVCAKETGGGMQMQDDVFQVVTNLLGSPGKPKFPALYHPGLECCTKLGITEPDPLEIKNYDALCTKVYVANYDNNLGHCVKLFHESREASLPRDEKCKSTYFNMLADENLEKDFDILPKTHHGPPTRCAVCRKEVQQNPIPAVPWSKVFSMDILSEVLPKPVRSARLAIYYSEYSPAPSFANQEDKFPNRPCGVRYVLTWADNSLPMYVSPEFYSLYADHGAQNFEFIESRTLQEKPRKTVAVAPYTNINVRSGTCFSPDARQANKDLMDVITSFNIQIVSLHVTLNYQGDCLFFAAIVRDIAGQMDLVPRQHLILLEITQVTLGDGNVGCVDQLLQNMLPFDEVKVLVFRNMVPQYSQSDIRITQSIFPQLHGVYVPEYPKMCLWVDPQLGRDLFRWHFMPTCTFGEGYEDYFSKKEQMFKYTSSGGEWSVKQLRSISDICECMSSYPYPESMWEAAHIQLPGSDARLQDGIDANNKIQIINSLPVLAKFLGHPLLRRLSTVNKTLHRVYGTQPTCLPF